MKNNNLIKIGVKFCGGCNPGYDRIGLVEEIREKLAGKAELVSHQEESTSCQLLIAGCKTACVDTTPFREKKLYFITDPGEAKEFIRKIEAYCTQDNT